MEKIFERQWNEPHFKKLINEVPYFAIWDDHDAGTDNITPQDTSCRKKEMFQTARKSFIKKIFDRNKIKSDTRIKNFRVGHNKIDFGTTEVLFGDKEPLDYSFEVGNIQFIMLDGISSRSKTTILTDEQFISLETKFKNHNGLTILSTGASLALGSAKWRWNGSRYKDDYRRLLKIIKNNKVIVLTGDIHENATVIPDPLGNPSVPFFELVSSGVALGNGEGNFLVLDIHNINSREEWDVNFQHYGDSMKSKHKQKEGVILIPPTRQ
ncbi:MAG: hypothetical protein GQ582_12785 [Methyloprofundus sp.]|nr:hypothetical protein [Methyloprofundus sp.]